MPPGGSPFCARRTAARGGLPDPLRQARGRRGLDALNDLRRIKNLDLRIHESDVGKRQDVDAKLVFLAQSLRSKLLTTDYNLAKMAEFHACNGSTSIISPKPFAQELIVGDTIEIDLVKLGKEEGQAWALWRTAPWWWWRSAQPYRATVSVEITSVSPQPAERWFSRVPRDRDLTQPADCRRFASSRTHPQNHEAALFRGRPA